MKRIMSLVTLLAFAASGCTSLDPQPVCHGWPAGKYIGDTFVIREYSDQKGYIEQSDNALTSPIYPHLSLLVETESPVCVFGRGPVRYTQRWRIAIPAQVALAPFGGVAWLLSFGSANMWKREHVKEWTEVESHPTSWNPTADLGTETVTTVRRRAPAPGALLAYKCECNDGGMLRLLGEGVAIADPQGIAVVDMTPYMAQIRGGRDAMLTVSLSGFPKCKKAFPIKLAARGQ